MSEEKKLEKSLDKKIKEQELQILVEELLDDIEERGKICLECGYIRDISSNKSNICEKCGFDFGSIDAQLGYDKILKPSVEKLSEAVGISTKLAHRTLISAIQQYVLKKMRE